MRRSARLAGRPVGSGSGSSTSTSISTSTSSVSSSSSIPGIAQTTAYSYNSRDVWIIIGARSLRQVGVGLVGVILSLQLQELRLDLRQLGTVLTASLTGATAFLLALPVLLSGAAGLPFVVAKGELLVGFTLVSAACALALPHCRSFLEVLVVVFVGSLGLPPSVAVQVPLEHSILAACVSQPPPGTTAASSDQQQQLARLLDRGRQLRLADLGAVRAAEGRAGELREVIARALGARARREVGVGRLDGRHGERGIGSRRRQRAPAENGRRQ